MPGARVLHLLGSRRHFPRRVETDYPQRDPCFYHAVALVDGKVIDWSRRQLDPFAPHPFVQSIARTRMEWHRLGFTETAIGI